MNLILLVKNWKYAVMFLLAALLSISTAGWQNSNNKIKLMSAEHESQLAGLQLQHINATRAIEQEGVNNVIKAVNESKAREAIIAASANDANDAVKRLSDTIDKLSTNAKTDAEFRNKYIDNSGRVLKECVGEYRKMAEVADRLSNNLILSQQASKR